MTMQQLSVKNEQTHGVAILGLIVISSLVTGRLFVKPKRKYKKKRKVLSDEHKAKTAVARIGQKHTLMTKQKIAESRTHK
jgi:hypothetical protein